MTKHASLARFDELRYHDDANRDIRFCNILLH